MQYNSYTGGNQAVNPYAPYQTMPTYTQQPAQQNGNTGSILTIFVSSDEEVDHYPVAAGLSVLLVNFSSKKFYLKSTSTSGVPQQLRTFEFTETTPTQIQNGTNSVTRSEFEALSNKLDQLINELGGTKHE